MIICFYSEILDSFKNVNVIIIFMDIENVSDLMLSGNKIEIRIFFMWLL